MKRSTLEQLKERLLQRLVSGEIDRTMYDQLLAELDAVDDTSPEIDFREWGREWGTFLDTSVRRIGLIADQENEPEAVRVRRLLRLLTILVLIHAVNTISLGVLRALSPDSPLLGMFAIVLGGVLIEAGRRLKTLQSYTFVWWSMFLVIAPIFVFWPFGLLVGFFGLMLLADPNVQTLFQGESPNDTPSPKRSTASPTYRETKEERRERQRLAKYQ